MSRETVEAVRRGWEVVQAEGFQAWLEQFVRHRAVYVQDASVGPEAQTWLGWDGWREGVEAWFAEFDDWEVQIGEVLDTGDDRVVVTCGWVSCWPS